MKICVAHFEDVASYPPVLSLVENLLCNGHKVWLISSNIDKLPERVKKSRNLICIETLSFTINDKLVHRVVRRMERDRRGKEEVRKLSGKVDILWTTTDTTVRALREEVKCFRHVMQLMELISWMPRYGSVSWPRFPIDEYAQKAWRCVVPEINRAYIEQVWWKLPKVPYVLPNKPYRAEPGEALPEMQDILQRMEQERRKVVLYLGMIGGDRNLEAIAQAVEEQSEEYCLYVAGRIAQNVRKEFEELQKKYPSMVYAGYYPAPKHLLLVKYAHIGVLAYAPGQMDRLSELNALYCAPNKIFEYTCYGVPMLGSDVLGLRLPFEQYDMGVCCDITDPRAILAALHKIEERYDEMRANSRKYYDSVDLDKIVERILSDEG